MAVPVESNLVALLDDHSTFLREGFQRVSRDEEGGLDIELVKQSQQTANTNCPSKETA